MIILPKVKLEKVCSTNDERPILQNPYLLVNKTIGRDGKVTETPGDGTIAATNGFMLAVLPVKHGDLDVSGILPNTTIKASLKDAKKEPALMAQENPEPQKYTFPNVARIVNLRPRQPEDELVSIALDADKLLALADAICERQSIYTKPLRFVKLTFSSSKPNAPILVEPCNVDGDGFGLLMPLHIRS